MNTPNKNINLVNQNKIEDQNESMSHAEYSNMRVCYSLSSLNKQTSEKSDALNDLQEMHRYEDSATQKVQTPDPVIIKNNDFFEIFHSGSKLIYPVSICLLTAVFIVTSVKGDTAVNPVIARPGGLAQRLTEFWKKFQAWIIIGIVCKFLVITFILVVLYKYRRYKALKVYLFLVYVGLLFLCPLIYIREFIRINNFAMDYITVALIIWNFGAVGLICIHWKGPLLLQQAYYILMTSFLAFCCIQFFSADWTIIWCMLGAISLYDLLAVLCPYGPLRILVNTAKERDEDLFPSLVYSSAARSPAISIHYCKDVPTADESRNLDCKEHVDDLNCEDNHRLAARLLDGHQAPVQLEASAEVSTNMEIHNAQLGLGDFIFYSVLIGKVSYDEGWNTTIACYFAILIGLCLTLLLLAMYRKALPALPISITFGLVFNFATSYFVQPFTDALTSEQAFI